MNRDNINLIKNVDFFSDISKIEIEKMIEEKECVILNYHKGEYVAFRGDTIDGIYINIDGLLVAEMLREDGNVKKIEEIKNGKIIASAFIFGNVNKFPVDLLAKTDVKILFISKEKLVKFLINNSKLLVEFLNEISNKAQFLSKNLWESLSNKTINQKLSEYILKNEEDGVFILEKSVKELSEYFNVSRPSLSRVFKYFIENEIIKKLEKGRYQIISKKKLKEIK